MFDNDRSKDNQPRWVVPALFAMALVLTAALAYVVWATSNNWNASQQSARHIQSNAQRYERERCIGLDVAAGIKCIADTREAAANQERDEADLYAQRQMAVWAFLVAVTAFVSIPLSITGIYFVWRSLALNRDAVNAATDSNKVAREIGEAQVRAYLTCISGDYRQTRQSIICNIVIENTGQSPASEVTLEAFLSVVIMTDDPDHPRPLIGAATETPELGSAQVVPANGKVIAKVYWYRNALDEKLAELVDLDGLPTVYCKITWRDVFKVSQSIDVSLHSIGREPKKVRPLSKRFGKLSAFVNEISDPKKTG